LGVLLVLFGVVWLVAPSVPWLGRLPGDLRVEKGGVRFYFPLATCLLISALLTLGMWLGRALTR
jgi:hypothetical protein